MRLFAGAVMIHTQFRFFSYLLVTLETGGPKVEAEEAEADK